MKHLHTLEGRYARVKMLSNFTLRFAKVELPDESGAVCRRWLQLTVSGEPPSPVVEILAKEYANVGLFKRWL